MEVDVVLAGQRMKTLKYQMKKCMVEIVNETLLFVVIYDLIIILYVSLYGTLFHCCFCLFSYSLLCSPVYLFTALFTCLSSLVFIIFSLFSHLIYLSL